MQFGLEPAGELGADGRPTYIQTVPFKSRRTGTEGKTYNAMAKIQGTDKAARFGGDLVDLAPRSPGRSRHRSGGGQDI